jgi:hypothetical protein
MDSSTMGDFVILSLILENWKFILFVIIVSALLIVLITIQNKPKGTTNAQAIANLRQSNLKAQGQVTLKKEGFTKSQPSAKPLEGFVDSMTGQNSLYKTLLNELLPAERYLVNLQPLTANVGGFIGPEKEGVFSSDFYVQNAIMAGVRSFVLPISTYIDDNKKPPEWPFSKKPAIVYRDSNGIITSVNGLTVKKFCESLLTYSSDNQVQAEEPIFLHIIPVEGHVPDPEKEEKAYVTLMRDIADELKTIDSRRLITLGSYGTATGGQNESVILTQIPLTDLKNKIIVSTTFDVRKQLKDAYKTLRPTLYEYANFLPTPLTGEPGITNQPNILQGSSAGNASKVLRLTDVSGSKINYTEQTRTTFYLTLYDKPHETPSPDSVKDVLKVGIQVIPLPFLYQDKQEIVNIWKTWNGFAFKIKEKEARYTKPAPIVPAPADPRFNARVDNSLQSGQMKVQ